MPTEQLIQAVAVTAELCGRVFTPAAASVFVEDLGGYREQQILGALRRCRREVRGVLTVQDVLSRIDDGRPGPDEAWAMIPQDEAASCVWTDEMARAWGVARHLLREGDRVGARMAFKDAYNRMVAEARDQGTAPNWTPSLGHDKAGRAEALEDAVSKGRLTYEHATELAPELLERQQPALLANQKRVQQMLAQGLKQLGKAA